VSDSGIRKKTHTDKKNKKNIYQQEVVVVVVTYMELLNMVHSHFLSGQRHISKHQSIFS